MELPTVGSDVGAWGTKLNSYLTPDASIQYVATTGNDTATGHSWGSAKATISAAIAALPTGTTGQPVGTVEVGYGTFTVSSTGRMDTVTLTNSTTVTDASCVASDVGSYLIGDNVNHEITIVSVNPGVSFVASASLPASGSQSLFITKPAIYQPGGVLIRGRGASYLPAKNTTLQYDVNPFLNATIIQDNGTGVAVWMSGSTDTLGNFRSMRFGLERVSVWGTTSNFVGVYNNNGAWAIDIDNCDISYHGMAGMMLGQNMNDVLVKNTWFNSNGSATGGYGSTSFACGGVFLSTPVGSNSAAVTFLNCNFFQNFGVGIGGCVTNFGTYTLVSSITMIGCLFVATATTTGGVFPNGGGTGIGAALGGGSGGSCLMIGCWFENQTGTYQIAMTGTVQLEGCTTNNSGSQYGMWVLYQNNTTGPTVTNHQSFNGIASVRLLSQQMSFQWSGCKCGDTNWVSLQTGGVTGGVTTLPPSAAAGHGTFTSPISPSAFQTALVGTTAGTATWNMTFQGATYKKVMVNLQGYENTTASAQTIAYPVAFAFTPYLAHDDSGGSSTSTSTLTLPANMGSTKTGWIVVEGY